MAKRVTRWHGGRSLLNPIGIQTTAALVAEVEDTESWDKGKDRSGESLREGYGFNISPQYTLQFSDCDRSISYDLSFGSKSEHKATLFKINTMVDLLTAFRDGLVIEIERYEERKRQGRKR